MRRYTPFCFLIIRGYLFSTFFDYTHIISRSLIVRKYVIYKASDYTQIVHGYYIHPPHILCSGLHYVNFKIARVFLRLSSIYRHPCTLSSMYSSLFPYFCPCERVIGEMLFSLFGKFLTFGFHSFKI